MMAELASSYWANGIPPATVEKSLAHSLCFALLDGHRQVGFARVISDYATIAYLNDVFVLSEYRGRGLSKWLVDASQAIQNCRVCGDGCRDA